MTECNSHETWHISKFEFNFIECNSIEWSEKYRLTKINKIKDDFIAEVKERELMNQIFSKCIAFLLTLFG